MNSSTALSGGRWIVFGPESQMIDHEPITIVSAAAAAAASSTEFKHLITFVRNLMKTYTQEEKVLPRSAVVAVIDSSGVVLERFLLLLELWQWLAGREETRKRLCS